MVQFYNTREANNLLWGGKKMSHLLTPLVTKKLTLSNRLVMPPMATAKSKGDGKVTKELLDYYDEKTKGGYIPLVIIEHSFITEQGKASENQLSVADDSVIEGITELAKVLHKNGSKVAMQLNHAGSGSYESTGFDIVAPSVIAHPVKHNVPIELTRDQIKKIVEEFKTAAIRTKKAGFDAVEIHSAHAYLLNQFYSPITNKRTDEYGGDIKGRIRIHLEVIKAIREAVGEDFPILLRLGAGDYTEGGSTVEDSIIAAKEFEKAGVDILDISGGICRYTNPNSTEPGYFSDTCKPIKEAVNIPVILTGGITTAEQAEKLLDKGAADLIGVGRAILKNSLWAKEAVEYFK
jgi:2,4-dienoyl-CoA reductase-like NADH-dependent reductase (Old Yellow Enzyme family)